MDYYKVLGVPKEATKEDIRAAFKRLVLTHHPDRAIYNPPSTPGTNTNDGDFAAIREAYDFLQDDERRRILDDYGDVGVFIFKLFEQNDSTSRSSAASCDDPKDAKSESADHGPSVGEQVDALLAWHGIRLHAFLVGLSCLSIAMALISVAFGVLSNGFPFLIILPNTTIQSMILWHSRKDKLSLLLLSVLLIILDIIQVLLYVKVNYFYSILIPSTLAQIISLVFVGVSKWYQSVGTFASVVLLCVVWNGWVFLPYPLILLPAFSARLPDLTDKSPIQLAIALAAFTASSSILHLPYWVTLMVPIIIFCLLALFMSVLVPIGHYYIIRMIMAQLRERDATLVAGLLTPP